VPGQQPRDNAAAHRAVAWAGAVFAGIGVIGLFLAPSAYVLWVCLIAFGTATIPRVLLTRLRAYRRRHDLR
jgi:hypothetical protein